MESSDTSEPAATEVAPTLSANAAEEAPGPPPERANDDAAEQPPAANLLVHCARCKVANEVGLPLGGSGGEFTVRCCACGALNTVTVDTGGHPLVVAEGLPEWSGPPPQPPEADTAASHVPLKKRQKMAAAAAAASASEDRASSSNDPDDGPEAEGALAPKSVPKAVAGRAASKSSRPETVRTSIVKHGTVVIAQCSDGYYYTGTVDEFKPDDDGSFLIAWDDGDTPAWVGVEQLVLAYRRPLPSELKVRDGLSSASPRRARTLLSARTLRRKLYPLRTPPPSPTSTPTQPNPRLQVGTSVLALYSGACKVLPTKPADGEAAADDDEGEEETDLWFPAKVTQLPSERELDEETFGLEWDDGADFFSASCNELRTFLSSTPIKVRRETAKPKPKRIYQRPRGRYSNDGLEEADDGQVEG